MKYVESLNGALHDLFDANDKVVLIGEDLLDPYGGAFKVSKGLSESYQTRVISTPISESAITGLGIGMALNGLYPIVEIMFGDFITLCTDQIVNGASKIPTMFGNDIDMPLTIRTPMGGRRGYGPTHSQSIEALFLSVPNIKVVAPSHLHDPGSLLKESVLSNGLDLFIENKALYSEELYFEGNFNNFDISQDFQSATVANIVNCQLSGTKDPDVVLIGYGGMVSILLGAIETLFVEHELTAKIVAPAVIKPLDLNAITKQLGNVSKVLIIEEASSAFNWGAEVGYQLYDCSSQVRVIKRLGAKACPIPSAIPLEKKVLPQVKDVVDSVLTLF